MELINTFLSFSIPPFTVFLLALILPSLYFFRFCLNVFSALSPEDLTGKVVVITGASSGIGEQLAYEYARRGARLALVARREAKLTEVSLFARELGSPDVITLPFDVSRKEDCRRFIQATIDHYGKVDHLVNNAGILCTCLFEEVIDPGKFTAVMNTNFWGAVYPTFYALPHLKRSKGKVVVTSSVSALAPIPRTSFYSASKAALMNFYETIRMELGTEVGVTIVAPGVIESEISQGKVMLREGRVGVDKDLRDVIVGPMPVRYASHCARRIVDGACRGERYVVEPPWYRLAITLWFAAPEVLEWLFRRLFLGWDGDKSSTDTLNKRLLDMSGAKRYLYPESINVVPPLEPETKRLKKAE